jgi:L-rhamnose-H+ transport protein
MNATMGTVICALGGVAGATFALPFRGIKGLKYESYWLQYALFGLLLFPLALAYATCPGLFKVIGSADSSVLARCIGFAALWGLGGLTWGLMIRYLGIGLGLAIGCGLCSATGTLIPPLVSGEAGRLVENTGAVVVLAGVLASLLGIVFVGLAGKAKESELPEEEKKKAVAEFDFKKGMAVAIFSGIASAGMNFGLQGGIWKASVAGQDVTVSMSDLAMHAGAKASWAGMAVLVVVLLGGFAVNAAWCLWQMAKNRGKADAEQGTKAPIVANIFFAGLAGVIWACQFACQKYGEPIVGDDMAYIGFAVVMGSSVMFSSVLGILLGEWKGTGKKTKAYLAIGICVLVASFVIVSAGKKLAPPKSAEDVAKEAAQKALTVKYLEAQFPKK